MCLSYISEVFEIDNTDEVEGYKVFQWALGGDGKYILVGDMRNCSKERNFKEWLNEKDFRPSCASDRLFIQDYDDVNDEYISYKIGWHLFATLEDAKAWQEGDEYKQEFPIYRCKGRNIAAVGSQEDKSVFVCKELFIEEIVA